MIALMLTVELLSFPHSSQRAIATMHALSSGGPTVRVQSTASYRGKSDVLVIWGPGAPERAKVMRQHAADGRHALALDLAYWQRDVKFRVSIDAAHPQAWIMRTEWPSNRLKTDRVTVADKWNQTGPIIVAGIGRKARVQYGDAVERWEADMLARVAQRWPDRKVFYRRKQHDAPVPAGFSLTSDRPIDQVLAGASLVVTWHSNVAVDAIRLGIPVICGDGAASAVCASELSTDDPSPLPAAVRDRFLVNLAWFQWAPAESRAFWAWVPEVLS